MGFCTPHQYSEFIEQATPFEQMLVTDIAPWTVVKSNDKKRARINALRYALARCDYADKDDEVVGAPDPQIVGRGLAD